MPLFPSRALTPPPTYTTNNDRTTTGLRPYLTLPYLLSLTWLAYPILSLIFIVFRLQISSTSAQDAVNDAKGNLLVSCKAAEQAATGAASLPTFMAIGTNKQFADAINGTLNGSREALILVLTCMEAIINFIIDIYRSTFLCFLELAIRGGLAILIAAVTDIENFVQGSLGFIRTSIQSDIAGFNSLVQSTVDGLNKIIPFGNPVKAPQITIPSLDALSNVTLPTTIQDALTKLNASIPSIDQLKDAITGFVDTPFELVKADINATFANLSFDASILPVPEQNTLSFCHNLDTSVVDNLGNDLLKIARIGTGILLILIVLLILGNCFVEWYKWRSLKLNLERTRMAWISDPTVYNHSITPEGVAPTIQMTDHNLLTLHFDSLHPLMSRFANYLSRLFKLSPTSYTNLRFFFHYVFHPPALVCFLIGFFGLLSVQLQLFAIHPLVNKYDAQAASTVHDFTNLIATNVNNSMYNQSSFYADGINTRVLAIQNSVNDGVFGWVNGTTTTLNDTVNAFYNDVQNVVTTVFGGTVLEQPAKDFIGCIIGSKVEAFEKALTFLHDNLHVNLPTVNESALVLSPEDVDKVSRPISAAAVGGGDGQQDGGLIGKLVARYVSALKKERIMFGVFLGIWGLVVLMALGIIAWHTLVKPRFNKNRRDDSSNSEKEVGLDSWPPRSLGSSPIRRTAGDFPSSFTPTIESQPTNNGFWASFQRKTSSPPPLAPSMSSEKAHQRKTGSFDSFIDSRSIKSEKRTSRKLRATGRKAMGREVFVGDRDEKAVDLTDEPSTSTSGGGWISRLKAQRKDSNNGQITPFQLPGKDGRPKLTISTERAQVSRVDLPELEFGGVGTSNNVPGSAWSVSPNPETPATRKLPWLHDMGGSLPTMKRHQSGHASFVNVSRARRQSARASIGGVNKPTPDTPISPPMPLSPMFITPRGGLAPPQTPHSSRPRSQSQSRRYSFTPISPITTMTPVTFLLNATTRGDSMPPPPPVPSSVVSNNPFATPFDDENAVVGVPSTPKAI